MSISLLDLPLFLWSEQEPFTVRDACQGAFIIGGLGSGKTSGSGALIAQQFLQNKFGGVVLTAKQDELDLWKKYCQRAGREDDLIILEPGSDVAFNFLDYESKRQDRGMGIVYNIADVLKTVMTAGQEKGKQSDKEFWESTLQQLLVNSIDLCMLTQKTLKFEHLLKVVRSAPRSNADLQKQEWLKNSPCFQLIYHAAQSLNKKAKSTKTDALAKRLRSIEDFFFGNWLELSPKTRSIVEQMFFGFGDRLNQEPLNTLFCDKTTVTPEDTIKGKILVLHLPVLIYDKIGRDGQVLFKYIWQRAIQRRKIGPKSRPVFLWADEAHHFLHEHDVTYQSTARQYRACTVYITQNLPNYRLSAGSGPEGDDRFKALIGNLATKIFHANTDMDTNTYAADLIGKDWKWTDNQGSSFGQAFTSNQGSAENLHYIIEPSEFAKLKTGGEPNDFTVEAVVHRMGEPFTATGKNYTFFSIQQNIS